MPSVPVPEESRASGLPYVLTDIMTYFTMLVGIYFPSVTGEARAAAPSLRSHTPNPVPPFLSRLAQVRAHLCSPSVLSGELRKPRGLNELCCLLSCEAHGVRSSLVTAASSWGEGPGCC